MELDEFVEEMRGLEGGTGLIAPALVSAAYVLRGAGRYDAALGVADALTKDPLQRGIALILMAEIYEIKGDKEAASQYLKQAQEDPILKQELEAAQKAKPREKIPEGDCGALRLEADRLQGVVEGLQAERLRLERKLGEIRTPYVGP